MAKKKKTNEQLVDERDARLRSDGEDEMRRRWRDAERAGVLDRDPNRFLFLLQIETWAEDARPAKMKKLLEAFGEREAEFRQGIAQEALHMLTLVFGQGYRLGELGRSEWSQQRKAK